MADSVFKLVVDSKEYDSKIQRATSGLMDFEKKCREVGGTLEFVEKEDLDFVKALGQMETVSSSATGKLGELKRAFTELSIQYKNLTDAEKQAPYGKALAASLDQIKGRIKATEVDLKGVSQELGGGGLSKVMETLGSKIGIPAGAFTALGGAMAAGAAAAKVTSDAFKQNEEFMDEWGRTTEAAGTVYQGFLNALNTGDLGGFLRNIGNIISKSREAYDAMDQLGTFNAFNQIQIEGARTDFTEAMASYRDGSGSKEDVKAAADRLKNEMQSRQDKEQAAYIAAIKELAASRGVDEEMLQKALSGTYGDYETLKNTPLARHEEQIWNGNMYGNTTTTKVTWSADTMEQKLGEALRKLNDDELAHIQSLGAQAQRTATEIAQVDKQTVRVLGANKNTATTSTTTKTEEKAPEGSAAALKKQIAELQDAWNKASTQDERNSIKGQIDAANEALKAMTPQIEPVAAAIKDAAAMWTEHSEKIADVKARLEEFKAMVTDTSLTDAQRDWAAGMADAYQEQLDKMTGATEEAVDEMTDKLKEIPTSFEMFKDGVGAVGSLVGAMDNLKSIGEDLTSAFSGEMDAWDALMTVFNSGIGIMQTVIGVMEAINTLQSLSSNLSKKKVADQAAETTAVVTGKSTEAAANLQEAGTSMTAAGANAAESSSAAGKAVAGIPIVGPILAVAAIAAVLTATFAAMSKAKSAGKFAQGGIIPGNSFSGDNQIASVNAGELILSRSQQATIASQLQGTAQQTVMVEGRISGKDILLSANNTNRAAGGSRGYYTKVK